jgi:hypothetical protein
MIETITIRVGRRENEQDFTVHRSFATKSSVKLQTALSRVGDKGHDNCEEPLLLPSAKAAEFEVYMYWLYTGKIATTDSKGMNSYGTTLVRLYILAEYLKDEPSSDAVITLLDDLFADTSTIFESAAVKLVWNNLPRDDVLRSTFLHGMFIVFLGAGESAKFIGKHEWPKNVDAGSIMCALERREYPELFRAEDMSEVG